MNRKAEEAVWVFGPKKLGQALDPPVTDGAVYHWLRGTAKPKFDTAKQIVALLRKDRVTVEDVMADHQAGPRLDRRKLPRVPLPTTTTKKKAANG